MPRSPSPAPLLAAWLAALLALAATSPGRACTIFVLADADHALFCNNEDWSNPAVHLWFIPARDGRLGCALVGFDDGWAQGGVNSAGLAYDWVAGAQETYTPAATLERTRGNSAHQPVRCDGAHQWISGSGVGEVPSRKSKSQPSLACVMCC